MNCSEKHWTENHTTSLFLYLNFSNLSFDNIKGSEFLSAIAGVGVLFTEAGKIKNNDHFESLKNKPSENSVFFWCEAARMFSGGFPNFEPTRKYKEILLFLKNFAVMEGSRYGKVIETYEEYVDDMTPWIP